MTLIPSMKSRVWFASAPRMRTSVSEPAGPEVVTAAEGVSRNRAGSSGSPRRSIRSWLRMDTQKKEESKEEMRHYMVILLQPLMDFQ